MTTYTTTFSGQTTAAAPTNFTDRYDANTDVTIENPSLGEEDDRVLEYGTADSGDVFYSFDDVDGDANRDNIEVLCRFQQSAQSDRGAIVRVRASGTSDSDKTCYDFYINSTTLAIARFVSGSGTVLTNQAITTITNEYRQTGIQDFTQLPADEWIWARFRVNGTGATVTLQAKMWLDGADEPSSWILDVNDTSASRITAAGWVGFAKRNFSATTYLDYFSAGTNGDSVTVVASSAAIRATSTSLEVLQENDPEMRMTHVAASVMYSTAGGGGGATSQSISCIIIT